MIVTPVNPNLIEIRIVQTGCCESEFDSTYPVHLNGIIRQDEFQQSITNINGKILSKIYVIICGIIFGLCIGIGMLLFIIGGTTAASSRSFGFPSLIGVGIGIFVCGSIIMAIGNCIIQAQYSARLQEAVAIESMKYSTRSPTPCSWRLNTTRIVTGGYRHRRTHVIYHIVIEIGRGGAAAPMTLNVPHQFNQAIPQHPQYFPPQNEMPPPPPYNGYSAGVFCTQCGIARQNPMAKFCSSCGSPFDM